MLHHTQSISSFQLRFSLEGRLGLVLGSVCLYDDMDRSHIVFRKTFCCDLRTEEDPCGSLFAALKSPQPPTLVQVLLLHSQVVACLMRITWA